MGAGSGDHSPSKDAERAIQSERNEEEKDRQKSAGCQRENQSHQHREAASERTSSLPVLAPDQKAADRGRGRQEIQELHLAGLFSDREKEDHQKEGKPGRLEEKKWGEATPPGSTVRRNRDLLLPVE